jgi:uncharacterized metal-binding protein
MKNEKKLLPLCAQEAQNLNIILACDGAASVGQIGHEVAVKMTKEQKDARMCCLSAVAAESKPHVAIAQKAKRLIVINGCANQCASKILKRLAIEPSYEITIAKEGVNKIPTLDFDEDDVIRITNKITEDLKNVPEREH